MSKLLKPRQNLSGKQFGRLLVLELSHRDKKLAYYNSRRVE